MCIERQEEIIRYLSTVKFAKIEKLSEHFSVSSETIRRDLLELEKGESVKRVRGGAVYDPKRSREEAFSKRKEEHLPEKQSIVQLTLEYIYDHEALMISNGGTNIVLAEMLAAQKNDLTVITNSVEVAQILLSNKTHRVLMTGGEMRRHNGSLVGDACLEFLERFKVDRAIINIDGISLTDGIMAFSIEEAAVLRKMLSMAQTKIVLCSNRRFKEVALNRICTADGIDMIFTNHHLPQEESEQWERSGVHVFSTDTETNETI